jgi:hypothetical protein
MDRQSRFDQPQRALQRQSTKAGVFGANVSNGCAATTAPGHLEMNWPNSRDIVTLADLAGFEVAVPVARWKGFGGETISTVPVLRPWRGRPAWVR